MLVVKNTNGKDLRDAYEALVSYSKQCSKPFNNLPEKLGVSGFTYGSMSRNDNVMPDHEKLLKQGMDPLNHKYGNDYDLVSFFTGDTMQVVEYFHNNGWGDKVRLHIHTYRKQDLENMLEHFNKDIDSIPGTTLILPSGKDNNPRIINDKKARKKIKNNNHRLYTLGKYQTISETIDLAGAYGKFLNSNNLRHAELGLLIIQFVSAYQANKCEDIINKVVDEFRNINVSRILTHNTRTMYDPKNMNDVLLTPRYVYDGYVKLFRNVFIELHGLDECCTEMNAIDFFESLKNDFYESELPVHEMQDSLINAVSAKLSSRDEEGYLGVRQAITEEFIKDYVSICRKVDKNFFQ